MHPDSWQKLYKHVVAAINYHSAPRQEAYVTQVNHCMNKCWALQCKHTSSMFVNHALRPSTHLQQTLSHRHPAKPRSYLNSITQWVWCAVGRLLVINQHVHCTIGLGMVMQESASCKWWTCTECVHGIMLDAGRHLAPCSARIAGTIELHVLKCEMHPLCSK